MLAFGESCGPLGATIRSEAGAWRVGCRSRSSGMTERAGSSPSRTRWRRRCFAGRHGRQATWILTPKIKRGRRCELTQRTLRRIAIRHPPSHQLADEPLPPTSARVQRGLTAVAGWVAHQRHDQPQARTPRADREVQFSSRRPSGARVSMWRVRPRGRADRGDAALLGKPGCPCPSLCSSPRCSDQLQTASCFASRRSGVMKHEAGQTYPLPRQPRIRRPRGLRDRRQASLRSVVQPGLDGPGMPRDIRRAEQPMAFAVDQRFRRVHARCPAYECSIAHASHGCSIKDVKDLFGRGRSAILSTSASSVRSGGRTARTPAMTRDHDTSAFRYIIGQMSGTMSVGPPAADR
jgi:hypothetical protein